MQRIWLLLGVALAAVCLRAQDAAELSGIVTDPQKAVVPDVNVTVTRIDTSTERKTLTNSAGIYIVPGLQPGKYEIQFRKNGFQTLVRSDVELHVGDRVQLNFELKVGATTQSLTVAVGNEMIDTTTSDLGAVIDSRTIRELPLNGRSWTDLATLQPGVVGIETQAAYSSAGDRGNRGFGSQISISGGRVRENSYRIDGVSVNDYSNGGPGSVLGGTLGVDAIEEFSVLTANAPAEYGRTSAGVISAITRSGTNELHGTAYEFFRNSALDARNYFDSGSTPPFKRNQFGAAVGGPLWKNHTFFFADYEGNRQSTGITNIATVPSASARAGHLSTGDVNVDPSAQKYLTFWPMPNGPLLAGGNTGIYSFTGQQVVNESFATGRLDHKFTDRDSLFGTFAYDNTPYRSPDNLGAVLLGDRTKRRTVAAQETHVFSASILNSLRFGLNREGVENNLSAQALNPAAADTSLGAIPGEPAAQVSVGGITPFKGGAEDATRFDWTSYQFYDDVSFTRGRHSLKFGANFERIESDIEYYSYLTGLFSFGSLQSFLTNQPSRFQAALPGLTTPRSLRQHLFGAYVQDDWRVLPNLTLNLGLRYEMATVPTEPDGKISTLLSLTSSENHLGSPLFQNPTLLNFEPRIGLAWDPWGDGRTSVRAGFGIYDVLPLPYEFQNMETRAAPFYLLGSTSKLKPDSFYQGALAQLSSNSLSVSWIDQNPKRNYVMQWNFNIQRALTRNLSVSAGYVGTRGVHQPMRIDDSNIVMPTLTDAGYVWPSPVGSGTRVNPNFGEIRSMQWEANSIYHALQLNVTQRMAYGFQLRGSYTWGKSIDEGSSTIVGDEFLTSMSSLVPFNLRLNRGLSDFNIARTLVIAGIWQVPDPRSLSGPLGWTAKGWELSALLKANTGVPFTATFGTNGDPLGLNSSDPWDYPNRLTGPGCSSLVNPGNPSHYIKTECFAVPTAPSQAFYSKYCDSSFAYPTCINLRGNAGRNILTGPGLANLDFSLVKNNQIAERFNLQFRAEVFNLLNRANFQVPPLVNGTDIFDSSAARNPTAGLLTSTTTSSRQLQFGLKVIW
jgi:Carboxypeptidase regulatory-like domain/TonB-dependent Receptor Plug Domain/TonB dependent receptor